METTSTTMLHANLLTPNTTTTSDWPGGANITDDLSYNVSGNLTEVEVAPSWPAYLPIYVTILNVVVFFTGTVGNALVIVVVVLVPDMRTPMNWYLVNLSMADLLVLLVCQPAALAEFFARDRWFLGAALCKMVPFLEHAVLHTSTLIILAITVERYYAICKPLRKMAVCHRPRPLRVLPCVWSAAILTSVPFIIMTRLEQTSFYDGTPCEVCSTSVSEHWHFVYIITMSLAFFALPLLVLVVLYVRIIHSLHSSGTALRMRQVEDVSTLSTHRSRKQVIKMLVGIVVLFFVSLLPVRVVIIWQIFTPDVQIRGMGPERYYNLMWICRLLMYANSAGNPIIYSLISSKFQEAFWRLLTGARHAPLQGTPRGSVSSRRSSLGRWSVCAVQRNSLSAHAGVRLLHADPGSGVRLLPTDSPHTNGHSSAGHTAGSGHTTDSSSSSGSRSIRWSVSGGGKSSALSKSALTGQKDCSRHSARRDVFLYLPTHTRTSTCTSYL